VSCTVDHTAPVPSEEDAKAEGPTFKSTQVNGFGFVCFKHDIDARKALDFFHEKANQYSKEEEFGAGPTVSKPSDDTSTPPTPLQELLNSGHRLYVVPALKKSHREAYLKAKKMKFKKMMSRQNLYFRGFPLDRSQSVEETEAELKKFFKEFGEVLSVKLMKSVKKDADKENERPLGYGFVCFKTVEDC
jgi:RNA recognition motif-containing protein